MAHFSKFIRPGAKVIDIDQTDETLQVTAAKNPDGTIAVVVFNEGTEAKAFELELNGLSKPISIDAQALQTILLTN